MPDIHTTKEYEKCRENLLTRGKIGKDVYDKTRVAEAESRQGTIQTIPRTHHGERRLPDAEKYDLPGDYRLVVQRLNGNETTRVFLFVGSHDEAEQWLENNRGLRWQPKQRAKQPPNNISQLELEKQRLQIELKKREVEQQDLVSQVEDLRLVKDDLEQKMQDREKALEQLAAQVKGLEGKQDHIEVEQLLLQREKLATQQQQLTYDRELLHKELQMRMEQLDRFSARVSQLEQENQQLSRQLENAVIQPSLAKQTPPQKNLFQWVVTIATCFILLVIGGFLVQGCSGAKNSNEETKGPGTKPDELPQKQVIPVSEANKFEGKEITVRVVIKSTYDGFDWAFMVNSEAEFKHANNFTVVVEKESAGAKYKAMGIFDLNEYFKRHTVILATGKVEKFKDKKSGKERYQIRVKDPEQIQRQ